MYIPNDETQNYSFCRLQLVVKRLDSDSQLNELANQKENVIIKLLGVVK